MATISRKHARRRKIGPVRAYWANHKRRKDAEMAEYDRMHDYLVLRETDPVRAREMLDSFSPPMRTHLLENADALIANLRAKVSPTASPTT